MSDTSPGPPGQLFMSAGSRLRSHKPAEFDPAAVFARLRGQIHALQVHRSGAVIVVLHDGSIFNTPLETPVFEESSRLQACTYMPRSSLMHFETTAGDSIVFEVPSRLDTAPLKGRPTIYLDQNHWSTLTLALHDSGRIRSADERAAALELIDLAQKREVVLPMSAAHMAETCKETNSINRYQRALTITQLSAGWVLRDPLALRRFELRQAFVQRYRNYSIITPPAVTLDPSALHSGRAEGMLHLPTLPDSDLQRFEDTMKGAFGNIDTMLDLQSLPVDTSPKWVEGFQRIGTYMRDHPTGPERRRKATWAKFLTDMTVETAVEAAQTQITVEQHREWWFNHAEQDLRDMPCLGLFREVIHEKLSNGNLIWRDNDLTDMFYLTAGAGYCDYLVGEKAHTSHIRNGLRRLGRAQHAHPTLRSFIADLQLPRTPHL